ncbi:MULTISPECIES: AraC family transcriptional regulator [Rhizobium]|uniref:AraC family transcriptional regulator n=1 Tax=Rhizobium TaxID=379 RepID=UPI00143FB20F|nr:MULTISPECIES: AraC family transcriptional regulator [Rhizobium]MBY3348041.1 AraC family transcriptional regulator [Rhizobium laguerreae]MBY3355004.1 AraC family transcriptional regulator [Rhizobium laguerreae]MBY3376309.1 AraC family transcriptional regulator [Rhizobium laguerreae]MBY3431307.1 AraC family transcriptional regulator [Rhizobium laguerreae]MBY3439922.1 AraC family transcriptional regulator [Rhizobium laguerreae]
MNCKMPHSRHDQPAALAGQLAPRLGYNQTALGNVRILRTEAVLNDIPVLYKPGAVFVLQGSKHGILDGEIYLYDEHHYLAVSVPVPFRMTSTASPWRPLLAVYLEFDMQMAAEIATQLEKLAGPASAKPKGLFSSRMDSSIEDVLLRLLTALGSPVEVAVLGGSILRELHYRVMSGPQGGAVIAALQRKGTSGKLVESLAWLRKNYGSEITVADLARAVGMSVPSYHVHFKELTGSSPMQYVKAMRLHEARLMIARQTGTIAEVAASVGYVSPAQFSRDFKRHFRRTASEEAKWVRHHLGEQV